LRRSTTLPPPENRLRAQRQDHSATRTLLQEKKQTSAALHPAPAA
jgi:hypothetical protein